MPGARSILSIVVVMVAMLALVPVAEARLTGDTQIRNVRLLSPDNGPERDKLVAFVRVHHGLARGKASRKASHSGQIRVTLGTGNDAISRNAVKRLQTAGNDHLDKHRVGYILRFPEKRLKTGSGQIRASVTARQRLDLDGDGKAESEDTDRQTLTREPTTIPEVILPQSGFYTNSIDPPDYDLDMGFDFTSGLDRHDTIAGRIVKPFALNDPGYACDFGQGDRGTADGIINPVTGAFTFAFADGTMTGYFTGGVGFQADVHVTSGTKTEDFGGGPCGPFDFTGVPFGRDEDVG